MNYWNLVEPVVAGLSAASRVGASLLILSGIGWELAVSGGASFSTIDSVLGPVESVVTLSVRERTFCVYIRYGCDGWEGP